MTDIDPRAERELDDRLRGLAQTNPHVPAETRDAVKRRVLAALPAAPSLADGAAAHDAALADGAGRDAARAGDGAVSASHAVEPDLAGRDRLRRRRWLVGGIAAAVTAAAAVLAIGMWGGSGVEREADPHSRVDVGGSAPRVRTPPPPPPVAHTVAPLVIPPSRLEEQRVAGNKMISPDEATAAAMAAAGKDRVVASEKICVNETGQVYSIHLMKSSGFPAYDIKLAIEIAQWRYQPQPVAVCTAVTFIYSQR